MAKGFGFKAMMDYFGKVIQGTTKIADSVTVTDAKKKILERRNGRKAFLKRKKKKKMADQSKRRNKK